MVKSDHTGKFRMGGVEAEFIAMLNVLVLRCWHSTTE